MTTNTQRAVIDNCRVLSAELRTLLLTNVVKIVRVVEDKAYREGDM